MLDIESNVLRESTLILLNAFALLLLIPSMVPSTQWRIRPKMPFLPDPSLGVPPNSLLPHIVLACLQNRASPY